MLYHVCVLVTYHTGLFIMLNLLLSNEQVIILMFTPHRFKKIPFVLILPNMDSEFN